LYFEYSKEKHEQWWKQYKKFEQSMMDAAVDYLIKNNKEQYKDPFAYWEE
jgi:hypothetical protein